MKNYNRRHNLQTMTNEEIEIQNLVWQIEKLGAHPLLTECVVKLGEARGALADWIELEGPKGAAKQSDHGKGE